MSKVLVLVCFLAAFSAGLVVGMQWHRLESQPTSRPGRTGGWLARELNLTPDQAEELNRIWSQMARQGGREREERRRQLYRERDEAIIALIRPEDELLYEAILSDYAARMAELDREWRAAYEAAVRHTRQILTPEQQARYDELLRRRQRERGPHDRRRGEHGREAGPVPVGGPYGPASRPMLRPGNRGEDS
jgi:Spy/CpxP family protein refolding chaperone